MSLFTRRAIAPAAILLLAVANAQTCYYPDGKTISNDIPCNPEDAASACCGNKSFCLAGGLCYGGGIVTRGSCTDKNWASPACAQVCTDEDTSTEIAITACTSGGNQNTFVCGVGTNGCQSDSNTFTLSSDTSLVLRPAQIAALVGSSLETVTTSATATATAVPDGYYTGGAMAGLAIGIAVPLLVALGVVYTMLRRERNKFGHASPDKKLMYKLPDEMTDDFTPKPPPPVMVTAAHAPSITSNRSSHNSRAASIAANSTNGSIAMSMATSAAPSRRASKWTIQTASSRPVLSRDFPPNHSQTFLERYENMKRNAQAQSMEVSSAPGTPQELDSTPTKEKTLYELSDTRMST